MKNYELTALITPLTEKEEAESLIERIAGIRPGAVKIKLAYPIEKVREAFLASVSFLADSEKLKEIKEKINSEKSILRHIIILKKEEKFKPKRKRAKPEDVVKKESKKVDIEKIDQKIEEILK